MAEGGAPSGADTVANGEDGVEAVVLDGPGDVAGALALNYPETPDGCLGVELILRVNIDQVLIYGLDRYLVQLRQEALRQPDGAPLDADLEPSGPGLVDEDLAGLGRKGLTHQTQAPSGWRRGARRSRPAPA